MLLITFCAFLKGAIISVSSSENEIQVPSISDGSIELKRWDRSNSDVSVQSVESIISLDSQTEDDTLAFMRRYVNILFEDSSQLTLELKSDFGLKSRVNIITFLVVDFKVFI